MSSSDKKYCVVHAQCPTLTTECHSVSVDCDMQWCWSVSDETAAEVTRDAQMKMLLDIRSNQNSLRTIHRHEGLLFKVTID